MNAKKADGFLWPNEFGDAPFSQPPKRLRSYLMPMGTLFLRLGAFKAYGYTSEAIFASDCKSGKIRAKTVIGALTLGDSRNVQGGSPVSVIVFPKGCHARLTFHAADSDEANRIKLVLRRFIKGARISVCTGPLSSIMAGAPATPSAKVFFSLNSGAKQTFLVHLIILLAVCMLLVFSWMSPKLSLMLISAAITLSAACIYSVYTCAAKTKKIRLS